MNIDYQLKKILGRPTCVLGKHARLLSTAKILNAQADSKSIEFGERSIIGGEVFVFAHGGRVSVGDWCFVGAGTRIWSADVFAICY